MFYNCNNNCGRCINNCNSCNRSIRPIFLRGPQGPTGPVGPQGPAGTTINQNATIYNGATQEITSGTPLTLPTVLTNNGLTTTNTELTIPEDGTYIVSFTTGTADAVTAGDNVAVAVNGITQPATQRLLDITSGASGTYVLNLSEGDTLSLIPTTTETVTLNATGGPSATLTAVRIF